MISCQTESWHPAQSGPTTRIHGMPSASADIMPGWVFEIASKGLQRHDSCMAGCVAHVEHEEMEAIILLMDQAAVDVFRVGEGVLEHPRLHDSASSVTGHSRHHAIKAYAINKDSVFDMPLTGAVHTRNSCSDCALKEQKVRDKYLSCWPMSPGRLFSAANTWRHTL